MKVKIVGIPAGTAPESIREALNGLEWKVLDLALVRVLKKITPQIIVLRQRLSCRHCVKAKKTLAYNYWGRKLVKDSTLIIQADCCREI